MNVKDQRIKELTRQRGMYAIHPAGACLAQTAFIRLNPVRLEALMKGSGQKSPLVSRFSHRSQDQLFKDMSFATAMLFCGGRYTYS